MLKANVGSSMSNNAKVAGKEAAAKAKLVLMKLKWLLFMVVVTMILKK